MQPSARPTYQELPTPPAEVAGRLLSLSPRPRPAFWLYWGHLVALFGLALSNVLLAVSVLASPWTGRWERLRRRELRPLLIAVGAYAALLLLSIATSLDPRQSLGEGTEIFTLTTLLLALVLVRGEREVRLLVDGVVLLATLQALIGLGQFLAVGGADLSRRIQGTLSHYMTFAGVLLVADLLLCARLLALGRRIGWWGLALLPINAALLGSLTRSAWVGLAAGLLALVLLSRRWLLLLALPALLAVPVLLAPGPVLERAASILDPTDTTNYDRLCMAYAGLQMVQERPLVGQGPRMVRERYELYRYPNAPRQWVPHLHNSYLQLAAERGVPALLALLALLAVAWRRGMQELRHGGRSDERAALLLGSLATLVGFAVAGLFENNWTDTEVQRPILLLLAVPFLLGQEGEGEATVARLPR
ncbi:MAG TPA: O-antigen ligase family protein [Thermoanaerobaculia bacterium]|nr:O-antigen ligase family protein [Thermoanaerobaculia bacterium]